MNAQIVSIEDCGEQMIKDYREGQEKGTTTYFPTFDNGWTWKTGEVNLWTGYSNEGKSLFLKQLCMAKYLAEGKSFLFASPEDFPPKSFFDDLIHTLSGQTTDQGRMGAIREPEYIQCMERLKKGMKFLHLKPPFNTIPEALLSAKEYKEENGLYGLIIDPIMKFARPKDAPERDDLFASYMTSYVTEFAREEELSLHLVAHQLTPKKNTKELYDKPSMYSVKTGGSWSDGIDNVLYVHRPNYAKDKLDPTVDVGSLKIKKQKLVGIPQDFSISFDRKTNRYVNGMGVSIFDFDKLKLK